MNNKLAMENGYGNRISSCTVTGEGNKIDMESTFRPAQLLLKGIKPDTDFACHRVQSLIRRIKEMRKDDI